MIIDKFVILRDLGHVKPALSTNLKLIIEITAILHVYMNIKAWSIKYKQINILSLANVIPEIDWT